MKIKKILMANILIWMVSLNVHCQDMITMKNGDKIKAVVLEIGPDQIKYKLFDNIEGPTYTIWKSDAITIEHKNGTKEIINISRNTETGKDTLKMTNLTYSKGKVYSAGKIVEPESLKKLFEAKPNALIYYQKSRTAGVVADITGYSSIALFVAGALTKDTDKSFIYYGSGGCCALIAIIAGRGIARNNLRKSIAIYNSHDKRIGYLNFGFNSNGIGIAMRF